MRMTSAALALAGVGVLAATSATVASAYPASTSQRQATANCKNDGHKYIIGKQATRNGKKATFVGEFARFHPCGEDDGHFTTPGKKTITLTLTSKSKIKVFKDQLDPSATKTVTAAQFPHAFKTHSDEPIYQYSGPNSAVTTMSEHFVS